MVAMEHPYSFHPADFVSGKLRYITDTTTSNYTTWREQIVCLIESQGLMQHIDDEPTSGDKDDPVWKRTDVHVKGWILGSLTHPIASIVLGLSTARQVWSKLEEKLKHPDVVEEFRRFRYVKLEEEQPWAGRAVNVANFVPEKLQWLSEIGKTNYQTWKKQMLCLITSQGLTKYIDTRLCGTEMHDEIINDVWKRNNATVTGWFLGSIAPEIASSVWQLTPDTEYTAAMIWYALEHKFGIRTEATSSQHDQEQKRLKDSALLHDATLHGNWEEAQKIFEKNPEAKRDWIDGNKKWRVLHIAVQTGEQGIEFVKNLLQLLSGEELLSLTDGSGGTALHTAAAVGNTQAAQILVDKNPNLCYTENKDGLYPMHIAAVYAQREVLNYLILKTQGRHGYKYYFGQKFLNFLIQAKFYDIAISLTKKWPAMLQNLELPDITKSPLTLLTKKMDGWSLKTDSNCWERFIFSVIEKSENTASNTRGNDTESQSQTTSTTRQHPFSGKCLHNIIPAALSLKFYSIICKFIECAEPQRFQKVKEHQQALQLLRIMCEAIESHDFAKAEYIFREAIFLAAELGVLDVAEEILKSFPGVIYSFLKPSGQRVFDKAILNRSLKVFNKIYDLTSNKKGSFTTSMEDKYRNNPLHLAAKLAPPDKLQETYGAALQMRRELKWFMEVEHIVNPYCVEQENDAGKTPRMVFTEEHQDLKKEGEKWMKETANSYVLVAVLIATVMFTGAITVPGGNNGEGFPMLYEKMAFTVFAISDTISLIASVSSLLSFLAILTSRYAEEDFLHSLPLKLSFGLTSLFVSILSMMVSFIATIYLVFKEKKEWFLFPLLMYACVPVALFALGQYQLLYVLICSLYERIVSRKAKS